MLDSSFKTRNVGLLLMVVKMTRSGVTGRWNATTDPFSGWGSGMRIGRSVDVVAVVALCIESARLCDQKGGGLFGGEDAAIEGLTTVEVDGFLGFGPKRAGGALACHIWTRPCPDVFSVRGQVVPR